MRDRHDSAPGNSSEHDVSSDLRAPLKARLEWRDLHSLITTGLAYSQFTSLRVPRRFLTRSEQERELILAIDLLTDVHDVRLSPVVVTFRHRGIDRTAEPILWVKRTTREELWFDRDSGSTSPDLESDLEAQLVPLALATRFVSLKQLLDPSHIELARLIRRHSRHPVDVMTRERVRRELCDGSEPVFWQDVVRGKHPTLRAATVCRLILDGVLRLSPPGRLRPETLVARSEPDCQKTE